MFNRSATIFSAPSKAKVFVQSVLHYVPMGLQQFLYDHLPGKGLEKARWNRDVARKVANELLENKTDALITGKAARDVMSILGRSFTTARVTRC